MKKHYTTSCRSLDRLLGGGFESGTLTQIYGAPGTGKTNVCIQTAIANAKMGIHVLYIDTDNCSEERYAQILGSSEPPPITFTHPETLQEQKVAINELEKSQKSIDTKVDLVLVDTLTLLYRLALDDKKHPKHELSKQALTLLEIARKHNTAVVITNQIYKDLNTNTLRPLGGHALEHLSKVIVKLEKSKEGHGRRIAILKKYHTTWPDAKCKFKITKESIKEEGKWKKEK
ncbi:MAG: DNA repair and recombination protein RadB [Euryarchaeota archaeon]|nr:DNA repair and recombination protein RadB [Euryarchaeota archaeon]